MTGYDRGWLTQITAAPTYLRRCNGFPAEGRAVSGSGLRAVLAASEEVAVDRNGTISWVSPAGRFTAEPVHAS